MTNKSWKQLKKHFKDIFLTGLGLLSYDKDTVKMAAYQMVKSVRGITLKLSNIYTNNDTEELSEVLGVVIPMLLDDCLSRSTVRTVRFFGVDVLGEIVKSSQNQAAYLSDKLGIKNKQDK
jgi:hypothetical protein